MRETQLRGEEANDLELPYLAPEVLTGRVPDARTDLFTLGVVAYQLVTGRLPYPGAVAAGTHRPDALDRARRDHAGGGAGGGRRGDATLSGRCP